MGSVTSPETVRRSPVAGCDAAHQRRTGKHHQENCQEHGHCQVSVHLHNYSSLSLYFLNWLIKDKGLPG